jgi:hypothetical protein
MIENIIRTATGYRATINGTPWTIPDDPKNRYRQTVLAAIAGGAEVTDEDTSAPQTVQITFAQLLIGLVAEGWITEADGVAWLSGTPPAPVISLIGQLPAGQRFAARARAVRPSIVLLSDPLVQALGAMQGKSAELPGFFNAYGAA